MKDRSSQELADLLNSDSFDTALITGTVIAGQVLGDEYSEVKEKSPFYVVLTGTYRLKRTEGRPDEAYTFWSVDGESTMFSFHKLHPALVKKESTRSGMSQIHIPVGLDVAVTLILKKILY